MPSVAVNPPKTPVTKGSSGIACATLPNVCKMPGPPAPFVPTPLPNVGRSGDAPKAYSKKVQVEGQPVAIRGASFGSMGDIASKTTGGGVVSATTHGPTKFIGPGSFDVKIEGKNVQLLADPMLNNCGGPANSAAMAGTIQGATDDDEGGSRPPNSSLEGVSPKVSQKQKRHIKGRKEWDDRKQGSYFETEADAQAVLDAAHDGSASVLGRTHQGHIVVRFNGVTGYNNNLKNGYMNQPTNVFLIKGTTSVSVVPTSPKWSLK